MARPAETSGLLLATLLALLAGCAPATNLTDPAGPRFGSSGRTERSGIGAATPPLITVVTFNIKYGRAIDRALEVLQQASLRTADVISLQEVDADDAERIARALRLEYVYYPATIHPVENRYFGSAVLSAWPIERDWKLVFPQRSLGRGQQRTGTAAVLRLGDVRIRVYAVHLETPVAISPVARQRQVEQLLCDAWDSPDPVVIAGDVNGADVAWYLAPAGYRWATRATGPSLLFFHPDQVFTRGLEPVAAGTLDARGASDHHPVWATLRLPTADAPPPLPAALPDFCKP